MKERIQAALEHAGMNQADLARRRKVTPNAVNAWVTGRNIPDTENILGICEDTGVRLQWLAFGQGPMSHNKVGEDTIMPYMGGLSSDQRQLLALFSKLKRPHQHAILDLLQKLVA